MKNILYQLVLWLSYMHEKILSLNDSYNIHLTDKQLHFLTIGIFGIVLTMLLLPIFSHLARKKKYLSITFIYVFTFIVVLTFAIEIGQGITGTGIMEFGDITSGLSGYLVMFVIFALLYTFIQFIRSRLSKKSQRNNVR